MPVAPVPTPAPQTLSINVSSLTSAELGALEAAATKKWNPPFFLFICATLLLLKIFFAIKSILPPHSLRPQLPRKWFESKWILMKMQQEDMGTRSERQQKEMSMFDFTECRTPRAFGSLSERSGVGEALEMNILPTLDRGSREGNWV